MSGNILIADDEEDIREIIQMFLEARGFETAVAYDGVDALDKARTQRPDLIVLDIMMPLMSGFEVCEKLKADEETRNIKILMLSAADHSESEEKGRAAGADGYMFKPFEPEELEDSIRKLLA